MVRRPWAASVLSLGTCSVVAGLPVNLLACDMLGSRNQGVLSFEEGQLLRQCCAGTGQVV
jgi:hypothetical protein